MPKKNQTSQVVKAAEKVEKKIEEKQIHDIAKLVKEWANEQAQMAHTKLEWVDFKYEHSKTKEFNANNVLEFRTMVGSMYYDDKNVKVLLPEKNSKHTLHTTVTNNEISTSDMSLNFSQAVTDEVSHSMTIAVSVGLSVGVTTGFFGASLSAGLDISSTDAQSINKTFQFNPNSKVKVKGLHKAEIEAVLTPIPEIHPFMIDLTIVGHIPVCFKDSVKFNEGEQSFKKSALQGGEKLHFISISTIVKDLISKGRLPGVKYHVDEQTNSVKCQLPGETKVIQYCAEISIQRQIPLPGAEHIKQSDASENAIASSHIEALKSNELDLYIIGYSGDAGVTFTNFSHIAKDKYNASIVDFGNFLVKLGEATGKALSQVKSEDIQHAIDKAAVEYSKSVDKAAKLANKNTGHPQKTSVKGVMCKISLFAEDDVKNIIDNKQEKLGVKEEDINENCNNKRTPSPH